MDSVYLCPDCGRALKQIDDRAGKEAWACPVALEAQRRGHQLFYYQTKTLALGEGSLFATGNDVTVRDEKNNHFTLGDERRADRADLH